MFSFLSEYYGCPDYLLLLGRLFPDNALLKKALMMSCLVLEVMRLILTVIIHKRYYIIISPDKGSL
jgi:hypothetical protein